MSEDQPITIMVKNIDKWLLTSKSAYIKIFKNAPYFRNLQKNNSEEFSVIIANIVGQLQLIEFEHTLFQKLDFVSRQEFYDEQTGDNFREPNEIEIILNKQLVLATGAIAEATCYVLICSSGHQIKIDADFIEMIKIAKDNQLIDDFEFHVLHEIRKLRNAVHLQNTRFIKDSELFSQNEADTAMCCLYLLLLKLLKIDEKILRIYFSFLPKCTKEVIDFTF